MIEIQPLSYVTKDVESSGISIVESGEPLVELKPDPRIHLSPAYYRLGYESAANKIWLRAGVRAALVRAATFLPSDRTLVVWDGLRSLATQRDIAERFQNSPSVRHLDSSCREATVSRYVAPPPADVREHHLAPSPHTTGGAVDLTLGDRRGRVLDLGARFDQFDEAAWLSYYERQDEPHLSGRDRARRDHRRLLSFAMCQGGFVPYPFEYWHWEYGTRRAAAFHGQHSAPYGPAVPFE